MMDERLIQALTVEVVADGVRAVGQIEEFWSGNLGVGLVVTTVSAAAVTTTLKSEPGG